MTDDLAKDYLHGQLRSARQALVWKPDGRTGVMAEYEEQIDTTAREAHWAKIERAAQEAAGGSHRVHLSDPHGAMGTP